MTGNVHLRTDHRFELNDVMKASDTFGNVATDGALRVTLKNDASR